MTEQAYLHFGSGDEPRQTVSVEHREQPLWWQERGLSYTASGYGAKIPSRYMIKWEGRWRRVMWRALVTLARPT
jgi:hypothetical protein